MEDTGASGSGGPPAKQTAPDTTETNNTETAPEHEIEEEGVPLTRGEAITAFVGSPRIPEPDQIMIDHISILMAVLAPDNGPAQKRAVKLLSMEYDQAAT